MLDTFINIYDDAPDVIELAHDFDEMTFYPIAVITMLRIYDTKICLDEYTDIEFNRAEDWQDISSFDEENWDSPSFFLQKL